MALGPSDVFDPFVCNKEFELFEHFEEGQVVNFEAVSHSCINLTETHEVLNTQYKLRRSEVDIVRGRTLEQENCQWRGTVICRWFRDGRKEEENELAWDLDLGCHGLFKQQKFFGIHWRFKIILIPLLPHRESLQGPVKHAKMYEILDISTNAVVNPKVLKNHQCSSKNTSDENNRNNICNAYNKS